MSLQKLQTGLGDGCIYICTPAAFANWLEISKVAGQDGKEYTGSDSCGYWFVQQPQYETVGQ